MRGKKPNDSGADLSIFEFILQFLLDNEPSFVISYTRAGNPKPDSYDRADSMVIAKAGLCKKKS